MSLPAHLEALKNEALHTTCEAWALRSRWSLTRGIERVGPCPVCGGTDRFSINTLKNLFNCRRCGIAGEGVIRLVMATQNVEFTRACEIITGRTADASIDPERARKLADQADADKRERERKSAQYREQARRAGRVIWEEGKSRPWRTGEPVFDYLALRGIDLAKLHAHAPDALHRVIRQHAALPWREQQGRDTVTLHTGPAMVAAIQYPDGHFAGAHITWLDLAQPKGKMVLPKNDKGQDRPAKKMRGTHMGCAIRLHTPQNARRIVMGEGIESTLSVLCHAFEPDTAYWAGCSLGNMAGRALRDGSNRQIHDQPDMDSEAFVVPGWCEELVFLADGDSVDSRITEKLTRGLRRAMRQRPGLRARRVPAPGEGADMNDLAMAMTIENEAGVPGKRPTGATADKDMNEAGA
ncbi:DUF7146 domain-containing protein [Pelagibacterium lentulum]|uniref:DNA primase/helicase Gp4 N-terminal Bacteriophage T7-like domain-containing protein n=1 Tax=Pelagibacterium lentulum TaxID=2029865 RepID=A0A916W3V3_9HYPH|nr:hypothetical protein [Pelagibacterium lentulum]GGA63779.1 hypothetical protein GCM10011499_37690 [Pelagibacterium lentulum]